MLKDLVKIANRLDSLGLTKEADIIDGYLSKSAADKSEDQVAEEIADGIYSANKNIDEASFKKEFMYRWNNSAHMPSQYDPSLSDWKAKAKVFADKMWVLGQNDPSTWRGDTDTSLPKATPKTPNTEKPSGNLNWDSYEKNVNAKFGESLGTSVKDAWKILTVKRDPKLQSFQGFVEFYRWLSKKKGKSLSPKELVSDMGELEYQLYVYYTETDPLMKELGAFVISKEDWMKNKQTKYQILERIKRLNLAPSIPRTKGDPIPTLVALKNMAARKHIILQSASDEELLEMFREAVENYGASENPWLQN